MIQVSLPGRNRTLKLYHLLLDMNGTLTKDGVLPAGVQERIELLRSQLEIYLLTADTFGSAAQVAKTLGIPLCKVSGEHGGLDKRDYLRTLEASHTVAIGNGYNDAMMLEEAALSIAVVGGEGCSRAALSQADIVVTSIVDGLDLLLNPLRLIATLRA